LPVKLTLDGPIPSETPPESNQTEVARSPLNCPTDKHRTKREFKRQKTCGYPGANLRVLSFRPIPSCPCLQGSGVRQTDCSWAAWLCQTPLPPLKYFLSHLAYRW